MSSNTIVINGKVYDAVTGLPVAAPEPVVVPVPARPTSVPSHVKSIKSSDIMPLQKSRATHHAKSAHRVTQKSTTLRRDVLKKPAPVQVGAARRQIQPGQVAKSPAISKFAPHPQPIQQSKAATSPVAKSPDSKPHSIVAHKHASVTKKDESSKPVLSSRALKEHLISERLANVETTSKKPVKHRKQSLLSRQPRALTVGAASLAIMILGGYFTYLNMPGLSVRVAAAQAGVSASFPDYNPDGYRFDGPVAYAPGQVAIDFVANGGTGKYTVTEQKSSWDSQAVYDNVVARAAGDAYVTNSQQGLTIYTFKGEAAWVNKGVLYTISGDAPLSNEQLLKIAASL